MHFTCINILLLHVIIGTLTEKMQDITFEIAEHPDNNYFVGNLFEAISTPEPIRSVRLDAVDPRLPKLFRINRENGDLFTTIEAVRGLDREELCSVSTERKHNVNCLVSLFASINNRLLVKVNMLIKDINDNPPRFYRTDTEDGIQHVNLEENSDLGTKILLNQAYDVDEFSDTVYTLSPNTGPFKLSRYSNSTPYLVLSSKLDYETKTDYFYNITACDDNENFVPESSARCANQTVHIHVINVDDEPIVFKQKRYSVVIKESSPIGQELIRLEAFDGDKEPFNHVYYRIIPGQNIFKIDCLSGSISLLKSFPLPGIYELTVIASDRSCNLSLKHMGKEKFSANAHLSIQVIDINNHAPELTFYNSAETVKYLYNAPAIKDFQVSLDYQENMKFKVLENVSVPAFIAYFLVTDLDFGNNADTICQIEENLQQNSISNYFKISDYFTFMMVSKLSEQKSVYRLTLTSPVDAEKFAVSTLRLPLDREMNPERIVGFLDFKITCKDNGSPYLTGLTSVSVGILDVDEFEPNILSLIPLDNDTLELTQDKDSFHVYINENNEGQKALLRFSLLDRDAISFPKFYISNSSDYFEIEEYTGLLRARKPYDYEQKRYDKLVIHLLEYGSDAKPKIITLDIKIRDLNDNAPSFVAPPIATIQIYPAPRYYRTLVMYDGVRMVEVQEEQPPGSNLFQIQVHDADSGINANVTMHVIEVSGKTFKRSFGNQVSSLLYPRFHISQNGFLTTTDRLDREYYEYIDLLIAASDGGIPQHSSFTSIRIILSDINDNAPQWQFPTEDDHIVVIKKQYIKSTTIITRIHAYDLDELGQNGRLEYKLAETVDGFSGSAPKLQHSFLLNNILFSVNRVTGEISVSKNIANIPEGFLDIWLQVEDCGIEPNVNRSKLTIYLTNSIDDIDLSMAKMWYQNKSRSVLSVLFEQHGHNWAQFLNKINGTSDLVLVHNSHVNGSFVALSVCATCGIAVLIVIVIFIILCHHKHRNIPSSNLQKSKNIALEMDGHKVFQRNNTKDKIITDGSSCESRLNPHVGPSVHTMDLREIPSNSACIAHNVTSSILGNTYNTTSETECQFTHSFIPFSNPSIPIQLLTLSSNDIQVSTPILPMKDMEVLCSNIPNIVTNIVSLTPVQLIQHSTLSPERNTDYFVRE